ncbi:hypothetical protein V6N13_069622 [Hibiscus sabdariffa]
MLCSFRDNGVVRTYGFAWLPLCKVFQLPKQVLLDIVSVMACCKQQLQRSKSSAKTKRDDFDP